jgi:hypothetical protein
MSHVGIHLDHVLAVPSVSRSVHMLLHLLPLSLMVAGRPLRPSLIALKSFASSLRLPKTSHLLLLQNWGFINFGAKQSCFRSDII